MERQKTQNNQYNLKRTEVRELALLSSRLIEKQDESRQCVWYCERIDKYISETCQVALVVNNLPGNTGDTEMQFRSLRWEDTLRSNATHSSVLA